MRLLLALLLFFNFGKILFSETIKDSLGNEFDVDKKTLKVATLCPSITEIIYAIGAENSLVANSRYCRFPPDAENKPKIGGMFDADYEKILILKPDLLILPNLNNDALLKKLQTLKFKCFLLHKESLYNIPKDIILLGELLGKESQAKILSEKITDFIEAQKKSSYKIKKSLVMFGKMSAGKTSYVGQALEACGLENISQSRNAWPVLSREFIIAANPEILIIEKKSDDDEDKIIAEYNADSVWKNTAAVKNKRIYFLDSDLVSIPGPRILQVMQKISEIAKSANQNQP